MYRIPLIIHRATYGFAVAVVLVGGRHLRVDRARAAGSSGPDCRIEDAGVTLTVRFLVRSILCLAVVAAVGRRPGVEFWPQPVAVEVATVGRGPLRVTVDEDGKTRIKERYVVSTPLAGRLQRIDLDPGDAVTPARRCWR